MVKFTIVLSGTAAPDSIVTWAVTATVAPVFVEVGFAVTVTAAGLLGSLNVTVVASVETPPALAVTITADPSVPLVRVTLATPLVVTAEAAERVPVPLLM